MAIERDGRKFIPTCDTCGDTLPEEFDFQDAVAAKKAAGWISKKEDGEWTDSCTTCQKIFEENKK